MTDAFWAGVLIVSTIVSLWVITMALIRRFSVREPWCEVCGDDQGFRLVTRKQGVRWYVVVIITSTIGLCLVINYILFQGYNRLREARSQYATIPK